MHPRVQGSSPEDTALALIATTHFDTIGSSQMV
jgi:hypothetical protein